jgi:hypothetical protein
MLKALILVLLVTTPGWGWSRAYQIFSVAQDLPMGTPEEIIKKNYLVNIGHKQGVKKGTVLDVFRIISVLNPYDNRKRYNYQVKIGELKVIHADDEGSITRVHKYEEEKPVLELDQFIVGDTIAVNVN